MRPCKLILAGVGPFPGREEVDFTQLAKAGLFLIHGQTGAGKSTLMDGITFALFGQSSGAERKSHHLRSRHAPVDQPTRIELLFQIGDQQYRAMRQPEFDRPAKRGKGMTREARKAELYLLENGGEKLLARRWEDMNQIVEDLMGMEVEQFRQVMMLPQGQFRRLLSADTAEREKVLQNLLDTSVFQRIEANFKQHARQKTEARQQCQVLVDTLLQQAEATDQAEVETRQQALHLELGQVQKQADELEKDTTRAQEGFNQAREQERLRKEAATAQQEVGNLQAQAGEMENVKTRIAAAHRAEKLVSHLDLVDCAQADCNKLKKNDQQLSHQLSEAEADNKTAALNLAKENGRKDELKQVILRHDQLVKLQPLFAMAAELTNQETANRQLLAQQVQAEAETSQKLHQVEEQLQLARKQAMQVGPAMTEQSRIEDQRRQLSQAIEKINNAQQTAGELQGATDELQQCQSQFQAASADADQLDKETREAEQAFLAGRAAALASHLEDSAPCPVCGSTHHPAPATTDRDTPDEQELAMLRKNQERARKKVNELATTATRLDVKLENLGKQLTGYLDGESPLPVIGEITTRHQGLLSQDENIVKKLKTATEAVKNAREMAEQAELATKLAKELQATITEHGKMIAGTKEVINGYAAELASLKGQLDDSIPDLPTLELELEKLSRQQDELQTALSQAQEQDKSSSTRLAQLQGTREQLTQQLQTATEKVTKSQERLQEELAKQKFASRDGAQAARLTEDQLKLLDLKYQQWQTDLKAAIKQAERTIELSRQAGDPPALEPLAKKLNQLVLEQKTARHAVGEKKQSLDQLKQLNRQINKALEKTRIAETEADLATRLAWVALGRNTEEGISFHRWVLAAMLEEVIKNASHRFQKITSNRYSFTRAGEKEKGRRKGGLDLNVLDAWSGAHRPVATLSGGEGFLAALSLTLGLAESVQDRIGGTRLEALFIDEGFGSLDAESLDAALSSLQELNDSRRMVGVISHVPELRERISNRLEITRRTDCSTLTQVND